MTFSIGIDVGVTGALAVISERSGEVVALHDLPLMTWGKTKWIDAMELCRMLRQAREGHPARAYVEHTQVMGKAGMLAASSKGLTLGSTLAALQFAGIPFELVVPAVWKRALGLIARESTDGEKKLASLSRARMLFPDADLDRVKDHNRAEALLIAHYGQRFGKPLQSAA
jgi:crossover junction endodeoxyribonuclease RuvC